MERAIKLGCAGSCDFAIIRAHSLNVTRKLVGAYRMSKLTFTFLVLLISAPSLFSQEHNDSATTTQKQWFTYTSAEGSYTVSLSEQPKLTSQNITAASGDKLIQYMA